MLLVLSVLEIGRIYHGKRMHDGNQNGGRYRGFGVMARLGNGSVDGRGDGMGLKVLGKGVGRS